MSENCPGLNRNLPQSLVDLMIGLYCIESENASGRWADYNVAAQAWNRFNKYSKNCIGTFEEDKLGPFPDPYDYSDLKLPRHEQPWCSYPTPTPPIPPIPPPPIEEFWVWSFINQLWSTDGKFSDSNPSGEGIKTLLADGNPDWTWGGVDPLGYPLFNPAVGERIFLDNADFDATKFIGPDVAITAVTHTTGIEFGTNGTLIIKGINTLRILTSQVIALDFSQMNLDQTSFVIRCTTTVLEEIIPPDLTDVLTNITFILIINFLDNKLSQESVNNLINWCYACHEAPTGPVGGVGRVVDISGPTNASPSAPQIAKINILTGLGINPWIISYNIL